MIQVLNSSLEDDDVTYVNASRIEFPGCSQKFLAASAPKPASFKQFWHMVIQEKVSVIVMITKLVEKNKRKAHQRRRLVRSPLVRCST